MFRFLSKITLSLSAVNQARNLVQNAPEKFARFNTYVLSQGYPKLVFETRNTQGQVIGHSFNTDYVLHHWGLVFPHSVQFYARLHQRDGQIVELDNQFILPIADIFD
jgi:hypothetical protein